MRKRRRPIPEMLQMLDEALALKPAATATDVRVLDTLLAATARIWH